MTETPTETPTASETSSATPTATETPSATLTESPTTTETASATLTETPTLFPTVSLTATAALPETFAPTATASPTPTAAFLEPTTAAPLPTEPPLFLLLHDTFDTGELPLWTLGTGWALTPSEGGLALQVSGSSEPVTFVHNMLGDVVAQARFLMDAGGVRLSVRQSAAGAYTASLDVNGQVALYRGDALLGAALVSPTAAGQWRTLRLSAIAGAARVAVDGVEMIAALDSDPLPAGTVSFVGNGPGALLADDVHLWIPLVDVPAPTATPQTLLPEPPWSLWFRDAFDGSALATWSLGAQWMRLPGGADFVLLAPNGSGATRLLLEDRANVVVQARLELYVGAAQVSVRQSVSGSYAVSIDPYGQVELRRGGELLQAAQVNLTAPSVVLRLSAFENTLRVAANGVEIMAVSDPSPLPAGGIAFAGADPGAGTFAIDEVRVWVPTGELAGNPLPDALPAEPAMAAAAQAAPLALLSPQGNRIAYAAETEEIWHSEIFALPASGGSRTQITSFTREPSTSLRNLMPDWSPDGSQIAFINVVTDVNYSIPMYTTYTVSTSGGAAAPVYITGLYRMDSVDWSPDGAQWVVSDGQDLYVVSSSGGTPQRLTDDPVVDDYPVWEPVQGGRIAFVSYRSGNADIYLRDAAGQLTNLTAHPAFDSDPAWSRDGQYLAFVSNRSGTCDIFMMDLLDRDAINLTAGAGFVGCSRPTWSPDGSAIAFAAATGGMDGDYELYTVAVPLDPQTPQTPQRLTDNALDDLSPAWGPPAQTPPVVNVITANTTLQYLAQATDCTLSDAIRAANDNARVNGCAAGAPEPAIDEIHLDSLTGPFTLDTPAEDVNGLPPITSTIRIVGNGTNNVIQRNAAATQAFRIVEVTSSGNLTLDGVVIRNGRAPEDGGGVYNSGALTLRGSRIEENRADRNGGGIYNLGTGNLNLFRTSFTNNHAGGRWSHSK